MVSNKLYPKKITACTRTCFHQAQATCLRRWLAVRKAINLSQLQTFEIDTALALHQLLNRAELNRKDFWWSVTEESRLVQIYQSCLVLTDLTITPITTLEEYPNKRSHASTSPWARKDQDRSTTKLSTKPFFKGQYKLPLVANQDRAGGAE